ncbi:MAG: M20 family metallopeptidase [Gemmatimonadota bacterium]|nr:M20 family metallopeptidase [Gemmatimonadota bacterium]
MNKGGMATGIHDSCETLLQAMVGFDTVNSAISGKPDTELALSVYLEAQAEAMGLDTRRLPVTGEGFNLLVSHQVDARAPWLLFESHLDTVSVDGMTVDPFEGRIVDGRMYGRGTCDTKGTGAAMLWALSRYCRGTGPNNVAILFTLDEEVGKTGVRTFVASQLPDLDWRPAGVIVGEPTRLQAVVAHNGVVRWRIRTEGVAVHSSDPSRGRSAIRMMTEVIGALEERYIARLASEHPLTGRAQCSINLIRGGTQINMIPEHCEIHVDRRVVPGEDPDTVIPAVERILDELRTRSPHLTVVQETPDMVDSPLDPAEGKAFGAVVATVLNSMGLPDGLSGVGYGTDASSFSRAGIPAVVLGPGDIAQGHTADEWIELEQLRAGVEIYYNLMMSECPLPM